MKKLFITALITLPLFSFAQEQKITDQEIAVAVDSLSANLNRIYVFPDKAKEMSSFIQQNLKDGKYKNLTDPISFADQITHDIQSISNDKHLNFRYAPQRISQMRNSKDVAEPDLNEMKKEVGKHNFWFKEVKILDGNIGYIKLNGFEDAALGGEAAAAVMNFVSYADAIIFDLRDNGGGSPSMIQLLTSYLYPEGEQIHLNNFYFRPTDNINQTWTLPFVPGKRNPGALVYVLTSNYTFSAAEEFTYNLKNLNRGTVVGEVTGGGAHPGGMQIITESFLCFIPNGRAINPITETNWEGVGVIPHVKTNHSEAFNKAYYMALDSLKKSTKQVEEIDFYEWHLGILNNKLSPYKVDSKKLKNYAGKFGARSILFENNELFYQREGRPKFKLTPLAENVFYVEDQEIKIEMEMKENKVEAIIVSTVDGRRERNEKN